VKNLVLFGPPGSGKGTHATKMAEQFKLPHIATGDLFREAVAKQTELGKKISGFLKEGQLVPDTTVVAVVNERLQQADAKHGFILDGYPRTIGQAKALEEAGIVIDKVIYLEVPLSIIISRMAGRLTCKNCNRVYHIKNMPPKKPGVCDVCGGPLYTREDDKEGTVRKRYEVYQQQTQPLVEYYRTKGILTELDGAGEAGAVFEVIKKIVA
jgi:adenylate kinase